MAVNTIHKLLFFIIFVTNVQYDIGRTANSEQTLVYLDRKMFRISALMSKRTIRRRAMTAQRGTLFMPGMDHYFSRKIIIVCKFARCLISKSVRCEHVLRVHAHKDRQRTQNAASVNKRRLTSAPKDVAKTAERIAASRAKPGLITVMMLLLRVGSTTAGQTDGRTTRLPLTHSHTTLFRQQTSPATRYARTTDIDRRAA